MIDPGTAADLQRRQAEARLTDAAVADGLQRAIKYWGCASQSNADDLAEWCEAHAADALRELTAARAELALLRAEQQRLEDMLRLAELALAAVVTMFEVPVSLMGGEAFSVDGAAVNQARMVLVNVNQERECRGSRRALRASGWQAPGEGEAG